MNAAAAAAISLLAASFVFNSRLTAQESSPPLFPGDTWDSISAADAGLDVARLEAARDYALTGAGSGMIVHGGRVVLTWGDLDRRYDLKSTTKSIGVTALGLAIGDGKLSLDDLAKDRHPAFGLPPAGNAKTGWLDQITLRHLATQSAGFAKPGGYTKLLFEPGTQWDYSDSGPNWLAECVTLAYRRDVDELLFERVFEPIGITRDDLRWRKNAYRDAKLVGITRREFGSGIHANVDAMARIGLLYLGGGKWKGKLLVPGDFIELARKPQDGVIGLPEHGDRFGNASDHYGLLWWNNADGTLPDVPRDAYWSWGLHDSLIVVIPSLDLVAARAGKGWKREEQWSGHYDVLAPLLEPIAAAAVTAGSERSVKKEAEVATAKEPATRIRSVSWAPPDTIIRAAKGSDNWPMTWTDDGHQYTAYGDGNGFTPKVPKKLSMGFARIIGSPETDLLNENIRTETGETYGGGKSGEKASGILSVGGVLYLWLRNADNSQLAWSSDYGVTWERADWKFTTSFGAPTFLNFGKDYDGAIDDFVYTYSFDSESAYEWSDRMVLARAPKDRIREREAWEFFAKRTSDGKTVWDPEVEKRGAVYEEKDQCYRSGVSFHPGLDRFLWVQVKGGKKKGGGRLDTRFEGGLAIFEAEKPWGPWTEVWRTDRWDVGPGETASFPVKWMSEDGRRAWLVFSGDDCFSVRKAVFELNP